jgi:hypothetical protein
MKIGINCGHTISGQPGSGAVGFLDESVETREVGRRLMTLLYQSGHDVYDCTNDYASSASESLTQIVSLANAQPLDLFVSIHFNSGGGQGTEVFTYGGKRFAEAENVCKSISMLNFRNRGLKAGSNLYVLRHTNAKAMLVEVCFVDTTDAARYRSLGADAVAEAIFEGITGQKPNKTEDANMEELKKLEERIVALENKANESEMIYHYIDDNMPEWAKEAVRWCADKEIITGIGDNKLNLNYARMWTCVVMYRTAKVIAKMMNMKI